MHCTREGALNSPPSSKACQESRSIREHDGRADGVSRLWILAGRRRTQVTDNEIDLREHLAVLWRRRYTFAPVTVGVFGMCADALGRIKIAYRIPGMVCADVRHGGCEHPGCAQEGS